MLNIYYIFFIINALLCLGLIFFKKRNLDFLSIYILILFLYTLPLFFGVVSNVYTGLFENPDPRIFVVMGLAYLGSSLFIFSDNSNFNINNSRDYLSEKIAFNIFLFLSIIGFILFVPTILSSSSKVELLENTNLLSSIIYFNVPIIGFLLAIKVKNKKYIIIFSLLLLFLLLFGARKSVAIAFMGAAIIFLENKPLKLISKYKFLISAFAVLLVVIASKTLYGYVLGYGLLIGISEWFNNFNFNFLFTGSEFITTSAILNSVLINDFSTDKIYYFYSFLALQPIPLSYFGYSSSYFNDVFQPALFPGINYGMAYNIWAEVFSAFGYFGVAILALTIPFLLNKLWYIYCRSKNVFSIIILIVGITFAFWIQRNSLATIFAYIRNIFYPLIFIYILIFLIKKLLKKGR